MNNYTHERKQHYVDQKIQGQLITALVTLELLLVIGALVYLYLSYNNILELNIYRIHYDPQETQKKLIDEIVYTVLAMSAINFFALYIAHRLWCKYINRVIYLFHRGLKVIAALDFCEPLNYGQFHEVLFLQAQWQQTEMQRNKQLRALIEQLKQPSSTWDHKEQAELKQQLKKIRYLADHKDNQEP